MKKREIILTKDGSYTLKINELNECYHSSHGALQEATHVFIKNGLNLFEQSEITILEMGFGTGLNALVTFNEFLKNKLLLKVNYIGIEKYPVTESEIHHLGYEKLFNDEKVKDFYTKIHCSDWGVDIEIAPNFYLRKIKADFLELESFHLPKIDLVYYDCFGARVQPELWEKPLFEKVVGVMNEKALLTTYSSKGSVRRTLQALGLRVEKKAGPPGKREMLNAWKTHPAQ